MSRLMNGLLLSLASMMLAGLCFAQDGVSTGGAARTTSLGRAGIFPTPRDVVVEDFINYHRHEIGRPKAGEAVALDVRWGNSLTATGKAVLQIGLATALVHDRSKLRPLNLSLVIDKSGSMAASDKLSRVKTSLVNLVGQLQPTDTLSIILFDSKAEVLLPSQKVVNKEKPLDLIRSIVPGSSTNIHAGLMLGYEEALKGFSKECTNRVILLTDGIANEGVTDPKSIARASVEFNRKGVDLSTIGVGQELNLAMLQDLAKSGRGLFHFVSDPEDIEKVFVKELQSLLSPVAKDPMIEIELGPRLEAERVFGYEPKTAKGTVKIKLDNLNSGATEVALLRLRVKDESDRVERLPVRVKLSYFDIERGMKVQSVQDTTLTIGSSKSILLVDESVAKNYTIGLLAQSIKEMAIAIEGKRFSEARRSLEASTEAAQARYPSMDDPDIKRTYSTAVRYRDLIRSQFPGEGEVDASGRAAKSIIPNGDFSLGNTGFTSDRPYIKPSSNCLWDGNYTVCEKFNSPFQLHTNAPFEAFSAPKGGQMMFMNTGRGEQFVFWSAKVTCAPKTKYQVSFQEIGLSGGPEWRNTYEIRINGERCEPQLGGDRVFVTISREWNSGSAKSAIVSIVRLPNAHGGGVVGIGNIEMIPVGKG